jgi:2-aminoadipate transaminase
LRKHFPASVDWADPEGGLYFWAKANGVKTGRRSRLFADALANEVLYVPGEFCYANDSTRPTPNSEMRLSFGSASELNIRRGIERLGKTIWKNSRGGN